MRSGGGSPRIGLRNTALHHVFVVRKKTLIKYIKKIFLCMLNVLQIHILEQTASFCEVTLNAITSWPSDSFWPAVLDM